MSKLMGRWIYDGDCLITSCCNIAYDIKKVEHNDKLIYVPCICPKCGIGLFPPDTNALELMGLAGEQTRNLTDDETSIYNSWIESEVKDTGVNIKDGEQNDD